MDEFLTPKEVATILKISKRSVINMIQNKKIKALILSGEKRFQYRILRGELDRMIAEEYQKYLE